MDQTDLCTGNILRYYYHLRSYFLQVLDLTQVGIDLSNLDYLRKTLVKHHNNWCYIKYKQVMN